VPEREGNRGLDEKREKEKKKAFEALAGRSHVGKGGKKKMSLISAAITPGLKRGDPLPPEHRKMPDLIHL